MSDRELLELAAKAAGYDTTHRMNADRLKLDPPVDALFVRDEKGLVSTGWNPLSNDEHAFRLAVKLCLEVKPCADGVVVNHMYQDQSQRCWWANYCNHSDSYAATRYVIVRAAAEFDKAESC
jgi:hypothetical protein